MNGANTTMKNFEKTKMCTAIVATLMSVASASHATNLLQTHFGVNPTLTNTSSSMQHPVYGFVASSLKSNVGSYVVDDWCKDAWGTRPGASSLIEAEPFDVEAIYFDADANNAYIAVLMSMNPASGGSLVTAGDIAIDFGQNSKLNGFSYDYAINTSNEVYRRSYLGFTTVGIGSTLGNGVYRTANSDWFVGAPGAPADGHGEMTNFDPDREQANILGKYSKTTMGQYRGLATTSSELLNFDLLGENGEKVYVLSAVVPLSMLDNLYDPAKGLSIQYGTGARCDTLTLNVPATVVPEPMTVAMLMGAAVTMVSWRRRSA